MTWPINPTNGQQVDINGITFEYNSTSGVWDRVGQRPISVSQTSYTTNGLTVTGLTMLQQTTEVLNTITGATGVVTHDVSTGSTFYHSSIAANFTANFVNLPILADKATTVMLVLVQGSTPRYANAIQIQGTSYSVKWVGALTPVPAANRVELQTFMFFRVGSTWSVIGQLTSFG